MIFVSASLLLFVYHNACKGFKVTHPYASLIFPLWLINFTRFRKARKKSERKKFIILCHVLILTPLLFHFFLYFVNPEAAYAKDFGLARVPIAWKRGGAAVSIFVPWPVHRTSSTWSVVSFIVWWIWTNATCGMLAFFQMRIADRTKDLRNALLKYDPFRSARFTVSRIAADDYVVSGDAFVKLGGIAEVQESIENAMGHGARIMNLDKRDSGVFVFQFGKFPARRDDLGRYVSTIKWEKLLYYPPYTRKFFGLVKKPNPMHRVCIPFCVNRSEVMWNRAQSPHVGIVGGTNTGKTALIRSLCASIAYVDPQTQFVFVDFVKSGIGFQSVKTDPRAVKSDASSGARMADVARKKPWLPNTFVIDNHELFLRFVDELEVELKRRAEIIKQNYGASSLFDLEDPDKFVVADPINPRRVHSIVLVVDEFLGIKQRAYDDKQLRDAVTKLEIFVSEARDRKVHIILAAQKGTVEVFGPTRDQLFMIALSTKPNENEYVLKTKVSMPNGIGICGFRKDAENDVVGFGCTADISSIRMAAVLADAAEKLTDENAAAMRRFRARCEAEGGDETMEKMNEGQNALLRAAN